MSEITSQSESFSEDDYMRGMNDCNTGVEHKPGMGPSYDHGYAAQFQHEQNLTAVGV